jgi:2-methylcitrate dehydratase
LIQSNKVLSVNGHESGMTICEVLASFVLRASYDDLSREARMQLKIRALDSFGCALGAMDSPPVRLLKKHTDDFGVNPQCSLARGGCTPPMI